MKPRNIGVALLLLCVAGGRVVQQVSSQTTAESVDCSDIGDGVQAMTGVNIEDVCPTITTNQLQCCTTQFIQDRLDDAEEQFLEGLRDELRERFAVARQILRKIREHLNGTFLENYFDQLSSFAIFNQVPPSLRGKRQLANRVGDFVRDFRDRFFGDDDDGDQGDGDDNEQSNMEMSRPGDDGDDDDASDERGFLDRLIRESVMNAVDFVRDRAQRIQNCVQEVLESHFDDVSEEINAKALRNVERTMATIDRIEELIDNITSRLSGFRPLERCVRRLVELNTCGRCTFPRPPFCRNVCGALARACYSPFDEAMEDEFERLWELIRQVVDVTDDTLDKLEDFDLFDIDPAGLFDELREKCTVDMADIVGMEEDQPTDGPGRRRRQDMEPTTTEDESDSNSSADGEDSDDSDDTDSDGIGKRLRLPSIIRTLARGLVRGPFGYPGRGLPGLCARLSIRNRDCWDGDEELDTDIPEFTDDDIDGQDQNPSIQIPIDELQTAAAALTAPVTELTEDSEFQANVPQTLTVPESGGGGSSGASGMVISIASLAAFSLVSVIFML